MVQSRQTESYDQAVWRLAALAQERGVRIFVYDIDGPPQYFATSVGRPGHLYRLTAFSCQCRGFIAHQKCQHVAALLDEIGELPPLPEPPALVAMVARRTERMSAAHARHIEVEARKCLESLNARDRAGEDVPEREIREITAAIALYAAIAGSEQPAALAA